ncbi:glycoside hydrolase [Hymenobacter sp. RP-2-7]|uniref:Glycoside hydrolase n=1 Tax=Hymenobacter polaris TaxID=2682546 RepID=A0A7Y0AFE4_9BACT|nr:glycosyl hydrolase [Hymenobacter polaris]NML66294.1 glycoside hydrolase [Hymenobacter polaris]
MLQFFFLLATLGVALLAAPRAVAQSTKVLPYLRRVAGTRTLAGQHNREPNAEPTKWTKYIHHTTGKYPALWSGDFLYQQENIDQRWTMIREAVRQYRRGAVVNIMWHACPPTTGEPCSWDPGLLNQLLTDAQWQELLTAGTPLNKAWQARMDDIAKYLQYLKDQRVEVLFRPLHEMNQGKFWWGGRPGPRGTARLYQLTHDYLTQTKGLTNLIWVWDVQDMSRDLAQYDPGPQYWDVFAFDVYGQGYDQSWYDYLLPIVGAKPMAIGECAVLPTPALLARQPRWVFFMGWAELVAEKNTTEAIKRLYADPRVLTRDELPGW